MYKSSQYAKIIIQLFIKDVFLMRVISKPILIEFWEKHPQTQSSLNHWYNTLKNSKASNFTDLQKTFSDVEGIGKQRFIFNIKGNHARIVCIIQFQHQTAYIRAVLTHDEYTTLCNNKSGKTVFDI